MPKNRWFAGASLNTLASNVTAMSNSIESALVVKEASSLLGTSCHFILGTDKEPFHGGECFVFALEDEAGMKIALRIPRSDWVSTQLIEAEVDLRKATQQKNITGSKN